MYFIIIILSAVFLVIWVDRRNKAFHAMYLKNIDLIYQYNLDKIAEGNFQKTVNYDEQLLPSLFTMQFLLPIPLKFWFRKVRKLIDQK